METKKLAIVKMTVDLLEMILRGESIGWYKSTAPADLKIHSVHQPHNSYGGHIEIVFFSESNPVTKEGDTIPIVAPFEYTRTY